MGPPLVGVTPIFALSFWSYDMGKKLVYAMTPSRTDPKLSIPELAFAGFFSAIPTTLVAGPAERVKVLLQLQGQAGATGPVYNGPVDVVRQLYKEGGLKSIFRGTGATLARDGPGSAAYFCAYEASKRMLTPAGQDPQQLNFLNVLTAGGLAGMAMWALAIPPDVIKSRYQGAPQGTYSGFLDCAKKTVAKDGMKALFKGFGPAMARAFPANAATFVSLAPHLQKNLSAAFGLLTALLLPFCYFRAPTARCRGLAAGHEQDVLSAAKDSLSSHNAGAMYPHLCRRLVDHVYTNAHNTLSHVDMTSHSGSPTLDEIHPQIDHTARRCVSAPSAAKFAILRERVRDTRGIGRVLRGRSGSSSD